MDTSKKAREKSKTCYILQHKNFYNLIISIGNLDW